MRYLRLFAVQLRLSLTLGMQYRWDFFVDGGVSVLWTVIGLIPLYIAFHARPPVDGWTYEGALVVVGCFTLLRGVLEGAVNPSLVTVVDQIRQGTLDFVILKPADAQFLVSTTRFRVWKVVDLAAAFVIFAYAFARIGRAPGPADVLGAALQVVAAVVVLYSIWILVVAAAFWVVKIDNLSYLFNSIFDFAHWPVTVFKGVWRLLFTFVIPLAIMTTYPAQALLGTLAPSTAAWSLAGSAAFALASRAVWIRSIRRYTSASS